MDKPKSPLWIAVKPRSNDYTFVADEGLEGWCEVGVDAEGRTVLDVPEGVSIMPVGRLVLEASDAADWAALAEVLQLGVPETQEVTRWLVPEHAARLDDLTPAGR